jgi:hypothetical protein
MDHGGMKMKKRNLEYSQGFYFIVCMSEDLKRIIRYGGKRAWGDKQERSD